MSYRTLKFIALASLIGYFAIGMTLKFAKPHNETYPFFSWYFFSEIPIPGHAYTIQLLSYGETQYDPPLPFSKMGPLFVPIRQSPTEYTPIIKALGVALEKDDAAQIELTRNKLEAVFKKPARYEVLLVDYDPLELWKYGTYTNSSVLAIFNSEPNL